MNKSEELRKFSNEIIQYNENINKKINKLDNLNNKIKELKNIIDDLNININDLDTQEIERFRNKLNINNDFEILILIDEDNSFNSIINNFESSLEEFKEFLINPVFSKLFIIFEEFSSDIININDLKIIKNKMKNDSEKYIDYLQIDENDLNQLKQYRSNSNYQSILRYLENIKDQFSKYINTNIIDISGERLNNNIKNLISNIKEIVPKYLEIIKYCIEGDENLKNRIINNNLYNENLKTIWKNNTKEDFFNLLICLSLKIHNDNNIKIDSIPEEILKTLENNFIKLKEIDNFILQNRIKFSQNNFEIIYEKITNYIKQAPDLSEIYEYLFFLEKVPNLITLIEKLNNSLNFYSNNFQYLLEKIIIKDINIFKDISKKLQEFFEKIKNNLENKINKINAIKEVKLLNEIKDECESLNSRLSRFYDKIDKIEIFQVSEEKDINLEYLINNLNFIYDLINQNGLDEFKEIMKKKSNIIIGKIRELFDSESDFDTLKKIIEFILENNLDNKDLNLIKEELGN
ncbi:MAG: hypothetical protein ACTSQP_22115 [Promethearchaeota archaeon]